MPLFWMHEKALHLSSLSAENIVACGIYGVGDRYSQHRPLKNQRDCVTSANWQPATYPQTARVRADSGTGPTITFRAPWK
ncbi:MAG: hypothetical protein QOI96_1848 [Verrucomicrobiota bacterium]